MTLALTNADRRREPRHRTFKGGRIVCPADSTLYSCRIRDMSEGGARLEIDHWTSFPKNIVIEVGINELVEARYEGEVRWTSAKQLGVQFLRRLPDGDDLNSGTSTAH